MPAHSPSSSPTWVERFLSSSAARARPEMAAAILHAAGAARSSTFAPPSRSVGDGAGGAMEGVEEVVGASSTAAAATQRAGQWPERVSEGSAPLAPGGVG